MLKLKIISGSSVLFFLCTGFVSLEGVAGGEVRLLDKEPDHSYFTAINTAFDSASSIKVRYMSKTRTYPFKEFTPDLDKFWSFELTAKCSSDCKKSEEWLYKFLNGVVPSTECPAMLSTLVEFNALGSESFRIYVDHAGHCIYLPRNDKYYFSKYRFNDAIKSTWGQGVRGM